MCTPPPRWPGARSSWAGSALTESGSTGPAAAPADHAAPDAISVLPIRGLPEFRPGDDLAGAIADAAPWLTDGDVLVVTSKVVSKVEGRLVPAPSDPAGREAARQAAVAGETVRVVAARGRTRIV